MRGQDKVAKRPKSAQTGWCWSRNRLVRSTQSGFASFPDVFLMSRPTRIQSFDQHHPGASRHPSSSEEGSLALVPTLCAQPYIGVAIYHMFPHASVTPPLRSPYF